MILTPFEGDRLLLAEVARMCAKYGVKCIFETGTQYGATTKLFALLAENVVTVEKEEFSVSGLPPNVLAVHMDSARAIKMIGPTIERPALFYLDAHGGGKSPILEELQALVELGICECPVVIHDFQVPGKDFGFDTYDGAPLNSDLIASAIAPLLSVGYVMSFNEEAEGCRRGACFLTPTRK